ncbi:hypothetical protein QFC20_005399 [Naganishia adeliensis]|uniref:Uncharacterized protein n=1 Tax=Naganishia adeliensis TaxID=92952 RepID=A0ACC2VQ00_9TREE|nr:hypothetical protein QFC20_005399 [Naganishia adeliensis]
MVTNLPTSYDAFFSHPPLIHPTVHFRLHGPSSPARNDDGSDTLDCALRTTVYLNDRLFIDPYELEDRWGPASVDDGELWHAPSNSHAQAQATIPTERSRHSSKDLEQNEPVREAPAIRWKLEPPVPDLERPVRYQFTRRIEVANHNYQPRPSSAADDAIHQAQPEIHDYPYEAVLHIIQQTYSSSMNLDGSLDMDIPTHMRYQEPSSSEDGYRQILLGDVQTPAEEGEPPQDVILDVSWSCRSVASAGGRRLVENHNDYTTTPLQLLAPADGRPHHIALPTAIAAHAAFVPPLTFVVVVLSSLYITRALLKLWSRSRTQVQDGKTTL